VVQATAVSAPAFSVRFLPDDRASAFDSPTELYLAAAAAGILVEQPCGSQGTCGRCRVRVAEGAPPPTEAECLHFTDGELADGWRLGCQLVLDGPAAVEIPAVSRSLAGKSFGGDLSPDALARPVVHVGTVQPPLLSAAPDAASLLDAVAAAAGLAARSLVATPDALADVATLEGAWAHATGADAGTGSSTPAAISIAIHGRELIAAGPASLAGAFGLAIDLGTTSLAAALVSLGDGRVAASASTLNPQVAYGADVISRIRHETHVPDGGAHLTGAARQGLAGLVNDLLSAAACSARDVVIASIAGNPTMMHAWLGVPAGGLGRAPYLGAWSDALTVKGGRVGLPIHPNANVLIFPLVRSHVGGDAVAAAMAVGLDRLPGSRLLIDLGTNTELLLAHEGRVLATSAAAGPAFEGVSIRHGMRGAPGALDVVSISADGRVTTHAIGGGLARGICGSGLIDAVAELLRAGVVASTGYLCKPDELPDGSPLAPRLTRVDGVQAFTLAPAEAAEPGAGPVVLTARDIREVQLAKGSIVAAMTLLCEHAGIEVGRLEQVLVAGAFGNYVRKTSALRLGLLPAIDPERVRFVGNAAGAGAYLAVLDREILDRARELAAGAEYVDLATDSRYQAVFMSALAFPSKE
jgi:uncharacterized 2Fe-2S/4Fe-4S cluster protein (DUF4445 family)